MFRKIGFAVAATMVVFGSSAPVGAQDWDPYTQCMIDYCFGNYQGNAAGYEACRRWCWQTSGGGNYAPPSLVAKLD